MESLNCIGLSCPQPVMAAKKFLDDHPQVRELSILLDNLAAVQNVERFLGSRGFSVSMEGSGSEFRVTAQKQDQSNCTFPAPEAKESHEKTIIAVTQDKMGRGDDRLGALLMQNFLKTLKEMGPSLWRLVFLNSGVRLTVEGAEALETLQELEAHGVSILVCGTCLNHFGLLEKKQVGETTNMLDIVTSLQVAEKVISF